MELISYFIIYIISGSSTDLLPSVIACYDHLNSSIDSHSNSSDSVNISTTTLHNIDHIKYPTTNINKTTTTPTDLSTNTYQQNNNNFVTPTKQRNFCILSQNVQRMISNSNDDITDCDLIPPIFSSTPIAAATKLSNNKKSSTNAKLHILINLPLSKNTCKLTQSQGNELVDTFDVFQSAHTHDNIEKKKLESQHSTSDDSDNNIIKTISVLHKNRRVSDELIPSLALNLDDQKLPPSAKIREIVERLQLTKTKINNPLTKTMLKNTENDVPVDDLEEETDATDDTLENSVPELNSVYVNVPQKSQPTEEDTSDNVSMPLSVFEETEKLCNNLDNNEISENNVPTSPTNDDSKSPRNSPRSSPTVKVKKLIVADTFDETASAVNSQQAILNDTAARLKHRPLSSSSICSTSSTSSSGSDRLIGKTYLASVESLADHSENELSSGMTLGERACAEIIDSEKSYVNDLGQVIKGYLTDWKEGACLKTDELKVLFNNIEEVYEFNSMLVERFTTAGHDPIGIAKCFIELRDRFNVYTTYW